MKSLQKHRNIFLETSHSLFGWEEQQALKFLPTLCNFNKPNSFLHFSFQHIKNLMLIQQVPERSEGTCYLYNNYGFGGRYPFWERHWIFERALTDFARVRCENRASPNSSPCVAGHFSERLFLIVVRRQESLAGEARGRVVTFFH